jgi:hypothetical protein
MSVPQGSTPFNTEYFTSATNRINAAKSCVELQALVTDVFGSLASVQAAITAQLAAVEPILALLTPPASNPGAIVTWLESFITDFLTPYTKPAVTCAAQLALLTAQIAALTSAITSAQAKFTSCSITVPAIP